MQEVEKPRSSHAPSLAAHLLVWLAVPVSEWLVGRSVRPSPAAWQWSLEFAAFAILGLMQWRFARLPWLKTLLWPPLVVLYSAYAFAGPRAPLSWQVLYTAGLILLGITVLKDVADRLRPPVLLAFALAFASPIASRAIDLHTSERDLSAKQGGIAGPPAELWHELAGAPDEAATPGPAGPPIVIISIDALRADSARTMKSWKRLASMGAWWSTAMSSSSWTLPAVASMQTGESVAEHGADCLGSRGCQGISPSIRTLAEDLSARGYRTGAVTANPWIARSTGLSRGFQTFTDLASVPALRLALFGTPAGLWGQDSAVVVDEAISWLNRVEDSPIYLWVHLFGPHMPYTHSPDPSLKVLTADLLRRGGIIEPAFRRAIRQAYDDEVAYTDREVGRLLDELERHGILGRGIIVLTSDHGEEFWEHGGVEHGHSHHHEVTEVPLVLVAPGIAPGERSGVASLVDLAPTLRGMVNLPMDGDGVDLRSPLAPERIATAFSNINGGIMRSARDLHERVIGGPRGIDEEIWQRFDLTIDPDEQSPLKIDPAGRVFQQAKALGPPVAGLPAGLNREALGSLGYAQ